MFLLLGQILRIISGLKILSELLLKTYTLSKLTPINAYIIVFAKVRIKQCAATVLVIKCKLFLNLTAFPKLYCG